MFGGQVLAQSVIAASRTVDEGVIHSLHAYFLRAGDASSPIVYDVDRNRDGRSFKSRRVVAIQHGRPIFTLAASFQLEQDGLDHAMWFHRPVRVDEWLLYSCDSPSASGGRGLARGSIYDRDGTLVASTAQEGMMRLKQRQEDQT